MTIASHVRHLFPSLNFTPEGFDKPPVFLDGAGGAQVPQPVIDAVSLYYSRYNSNIHPSRFYAAKATTEIVAKARQDAACFVNAPSADNIVFGPNMSGLTMHMSRAIARTWEEGDEIIITALDHGANTAYWEEAAAEKGVTCHVVRVNPADCSLDMDHFKSLLGSKTKLVAATMASNICGSVTPAKEIIDLAREVGALSYMDGVHFAPHRLIDVQALDCDFLGLSAYKFCGPHMGFLYAKLKHLDDFQPYKLRTVAAKPPVSWETGTQNFEAICGLSATIAYLASLSLSDAHDLSSMEGLRAALAESYSNISVYEQSLSHHFLELLENAPSLILHGKTSERLAHRTPTFALSHKSKTPHEMSGALADQNIAAWAGRFHCPVFVEQMGLEKQGGVLRVSLMHYNTVQDIDALFDVLNSL